MEQAPSLAQFAGEHDNNATKVERGSKEESRANSEGGGARKGDDVTGESKKLLLSFPMPVSLEEGVDFPSSGKRELVEVGGRMHVRDGSVAVEVYTSLGKGGHRQRLASDIPTLNVEQVASGSTANGSIFQALDTQFTSRALSPPKSLCAHRYFSSSSLSLVDRHRDA